MGARESRKERPGLHSGAEALTCGRLAAANLTAKVVFGIVLGEQIGQRLFHELLHVPCLGAASPVSLGLEHGSQRLRQSLRRRRSLDDVVEPGQTRPQSRVHYACSKPS